MDNTETVSPPDVVVLRFSDSKIPVFKETRNKDYIKYGEKNDYPEYLTYLLNKSAKHNAIITSKVKYIFGDGFENGDFVINRLGESLNDISKKAILDVETYGGFRLEVIYNALGKICEVYHVDYSTIRTGKKSGFFYKEDWKLTNRDPEEFIPAFNPSCPYGTQIYAYNEYRPMVRFYPLPSYIGCNNYIETDIEISKYYLSAIRNGMMPSKLVQFYNGEPTQDKKREIEERFKLKFGGAENAGKFVLVFNKNKDQELKIDDLSASEVDKQFVELNKTSQQEILSGHGVTSPMLFGIRVEGQLGGNTELSTAYTIFQNTYAKPKATAFSKEVEYLLSYSIFASTFELRPTDPIGIQIDVKDVVNSLPKEFVFKNMGVPKEMWGLENVGSDNRPTPTLPIAPATQVSPAGPEEGSQASAALANDNIKNLTTKQHQQLMRIIRQYTKGQLTEQAAKTLLRTGLGLTDADIDSLLGIEAKATATTFEDQEDEIIGMFDACGDARDDYEILKSKRISFTSELEAEDDEIVFIDEAFRKYDVTNTEQRILDLIRNDKRITPDVIADTIGQSKAFVVSKLDNLTKRGFLESTTETIGSDEIIERFVPKGIDITAPPSTGKQTPGQVFIKYSYEGPEDDRNRPFCAKMLKLKRLYSRAEIEQISQRLGYSVFDRRGGFWRHKNGETTPYCRHNWRSNIIVKKSNS